MSFSQWHYLELSNGGHAFIDAEDEPILEGYRWRWRFEGDGNLYVIARTRHTYVRMHRVVLGVTDPSLQVDHANGNGLDNRKANLRICTAQENARNRRRRPRGASSRFKGVTFHRAARKWQAQIKVGGKSLYLGLFDSEEEAARAYDAAAEEHYGEFAALNLEQRLPS